MRIPPPFTATLLLASLALPALASEPPGLQPLPAPPPMPAASAAGPGQPTPAPAPSARPRKADEVKHYRKRSEVYMLKVTPAHGVPYFLVDPAANGKSARTTGTTDATLAVPSWVVRSW